MNGYRSIQMPCNKTRLLSLAVLISLANGCSTSEFRHAEPVQAEAHTAPALQRQYSPETRQRYRQALALLRQQQIIPARQALQALLADEPEIAGAWYNLALIQYQQAEPQAALQSLEHSLRLSPGQPGAYTLSGLILRQQGQFKQARSAYTQALEADSGYAAAHLNLAILYDIYLQAFPKARHHYQRYLELAGQDEQPEQVTLWLQDLQRRIDREAQ
ncbi:MAG: tetratricopeptide (TPR) repeat protein [Motiliproteus sp.]|jgi:tetratricopeptide (TPR) repeat protein